MNLLKYAYDDATAPWVEDDLQAAAVVIFRRRGVTLAADQNAGKRSKKDGARRKVLGMAAGEPDVRLYLSGARTLFIEFKTTTGRRSAEQRQRHAELTALGFTVLVWAPATPADAQHMAEMLCNSYGI